RLMERDGQVHRLAPRLDVGRQRLLQLDVADDDDAGRRRRAIDLGAGLRLTARAAFGAAFAIELSFAHWGAHLRVTLPMAAAMALCGTFRVHAGALAGPVAVDARARRTRTGALPLTASAREFAFAGGLAAAGGAAFA